MQTMFKLQKKESFFWPVKGSIPVDGGEFSDFEFQAEIKRLPQSKIDELVKKLTADKGEMTLKDVASNLLVGWKGVYDDGGEKEVSFSAESKRQVLDVAGVAAAIVEAAFEAFRGGRAKN
jgi:hypothetical protein